MKFFGVSSALGAAVSALLCGAAQASYPVIELDTNAAISSCYDLPRKNKLAGGILTIVGPIECDKPTVRLISCDG